jgi:hypothetical protein
MAGGALAQPVLTGLGAAPTGVSNPQSGTYYISGSNTRWTMSAGVLTYSNIGAAGGGLISADGAYQTCSIQNNGLISGNTAGVLPAFGIPSGYAPFALTPATDLLAARYTAATPSIVGLPGFTNDLINNNQQVFGSGDSGLVHSALGMSRNGRFIAVQGYVSTYTTSTASVSVTNIVGSGSVATVTTSAAHLLAAGNQVTVATNSIAGFNGAQTVASVVDATHFTFNSATAGTGTGGTLSFAAGARVTASQNFRFRGGVWDANTGTLRALPTPFRTSSQTTRRRDGSAYAVSDDGVVVVGAQEPTSATTPNGVDTDGSRLIVYRWNGSSYDMSFLPNGVNGSGFPITASISAGSVWMNSAGTIIVGPALDDGGSTAHAAKWVWNAGTSLWEGPTSLGNMPNPTISVTSIDGFTVTTATPHGLAVNDWVYISGNSGGAPNNGWKQVITSEDPLTFAFNGMVSGTGGTANKGASWLPTDITSCPIAPQLFVTGMSDDGNTVVGFAKYSTCSSFMQGGWIWTASNGYAADWYDYLHAQNVVGTEPGATSPFGPIGSNGDYTKGMPRLGNPSAISPDSSAIVGFQGGTQVIVGAPPWILLPAGSPSCVAPAITLNPANQTYARCSGIGSDVTQVILNAAAAGTTPLSYQWFKGSTQLFDGATGNGSTITGATSFQMRITTPFPADDGQYHCVVSGCNGSIASTTDATVAHDGTLPVAGDTCSNPIAINAEGSTAFNICGCFATDGGSSCGGTPEVADIWFRYTPTFTGEARFQTCGSNFDSTLQLLDGCGGSILDCNNDVGARGVVGVTCQAPRSLISRHAVTSGVPIYVRVGMTGSAPFGATGSLTITPAPAAPANDLCTNPQVVGLGTFSFNLAEATDDYVFGADTCGATGNTFSNRDVWFRLNAPCGGTINVDTCGSTITNPMLHIMSDCVGSILACNDNVGSGVTGCTSNQARILNFVTSGSVLIRVSASGTGAPNSGLGQINITGTITPCCGSADFNCDGDVGTDADIEAFFACLSGSCPVAPCTGSADFNGDGDVGTDGDIEAFFRVLGGGTC